MLAISFLALLPLLILIVGFFFSKGMKNSGASLAIRPAPWVFGVAWFTFVLLLAFAWYRTSISSVTSNMWMLAILFTLMIICCIAWIPVYAKNKVWGAWLIYGALAFAIPLTALAPDAYSKLIFGLFTGWLIFAGMMNAFEVAGSK